MTGARRFRASPALATGAALTALLAAAALLSLLWSPYSPSDLDVPHKLAPSSPNHLLGTDGLGRDELSLLLMGAQTSALVGILAVTIGSSAGTFLGLVAAAKRGLVDDIVMRLADFAFAFPSVLSAILLTEFIGPGLLSVIIAIGIFNIPVFARVARASALSVWARDFTLAARVAGKGSWRISLEHVLPNIAPVLIVQATIQFATAVLAEAALSYLGLGPQPPLPSWGRMLEDAQALMFRAPQLAVFPGLAIALTVFGLNLLGDGLNDALDPAGRR